MNRGYSGTESLSAYLYNDYDLWKFKNNRDFTPVEVDAMTNLTPAQKEQLKNFLHYIIQVRTFIEISLARMHLSCRQTSIFQVVQRE